MPTEQESIEGKCLHGGGGAGWSDVEDGSMDKATFGREDAFNALERCWVRVSELGMLIWRCSGDIGEFMLEQRNLGTM